MGKIISLVGPRTVGKTTIGKELSVISGYKFIDIDQVMLKKLKDKGEIFGYVNKLGWNNYFKLVNTALKEIIKKYKNKSIILDLGGGTTSAKYESCKLNAELIKDNSENFLILPAKNIKENIKIIIKREHARLKQQGIIHWAYTWPIKKFDAKIRKDYYKRVPIFKKNAHHIVYTKYKSPNQVAKNILKLINT
jgi:shikimate kinase